jgi:hypothetical protein
VAEESVIAANVADNAPYVTQKGRVDRRMVRESVRNLVIDSGGEYVLLDSKERGDLYEIRVISDNPYLEVYVELDDWRNENASAAELLSQPETGRLLSNFQAIDGGSPGVGYTLLYNPDLPEDFDGRIRVVLRNRIRPSTDVFGQALKSAVTARYTSRAGLATPTNLGFSGGAVIPHNDAASSAPNLLNNAYGLVHSPDFYNTLGVPNKVFMTPSGLSLSRGAYHPYVGIAGTANLLTGDSNVPITTGGPLLTDTLHVFVDPIHYLEGSGGTEIVDTWPSRTSQYIYFADFAGATLSAGTYVAGARMWLKDGKNLYFPGVIESVADSQNLPTKFATNGGSAYANCVRVEVSPGLQFAPPAILINNYNNNTGSQDSISGAFGVVTSQADSNPHVLVHAAELRRLKRVSYDG